jgi:hypothetical protein
MAYISRSSVAIKQPFNKKQLAHFAITACMHACTVVQSFERLHFLYGNGPNGHIYGHLAEPRVMEKNDIFL